MTIFWILITLLVAYLMFKSWLEKNGGPLPALKPYVPPVKSAMELQQEAHKKNMKKARARIKAAKTT